MMLGASKGREVIGYENVTNETAAALITSIAALATSVGLFVKDRLNKRDELRAKAEESQESNKTAERQSVTVDWRTETMALRERLDNVEDVSRGLQRDLQILQKELIAEQKATVQLQKEKALLEVQLTQLVIEKTSLASRVLELEAVINNKESRIRQLQLLLEVREGELARHETLTDHTLAINSQHAQEQ